MRNNHYKLEPYKGRDTRYKCPNCGRKEFSRYIDAETGKQVGPEFGRCNREDKCGYHKLPPLKTKCYYVDFSAIVDYSKKAFRIITDKGSFNIPKALVYEIWEHGCYVSEWYFRDGERARKPDYAISNYKFFSGGKEVVHQVPVTKINSEIKSVSFIPVELFKNSLKGYEKNKLVEFLLNIFSAEIVSHLISKYFIGTSKHWPGSTVFWQIDLHGRIRTGKIMLYDANTGKRIKEPFNHISWVHTSLKIKDYNLKQCLFGEHLLRDQLKTVAIVESEKTAIIASAYFPELIWLACGGISDLKPEKCQVLNDRRAILFPDLNGFGKWNDKIKELSKIASISISSLLEQKASVQDRKEGLDLADYLIKYKLSEFINPTHIKPSNTKNKCVEVRSSVGEFTRRWVKGGEPKPENMDVDFQK